MKTLGLLSTRQLDGLLGSFPKAARIERTDSTVSVYAPKGQHVLSAVSPNGRQWHVMTVPGLVDAK